jgi:hypothetical protein
MISNKYSRHNKVAKSASFAALSARDVASPRPLQRRYVNPVSAING